MDIAYFVVSILKLIVDTVSLLYRYYSDKKQAATTTNSDGSAAE